MLRATTHDRVIFQLFSPNARSHEFCESNGCRDVSVAAFLYPACGGGGVLSIIGRGTRLIFGPVTEVRRRLDHAAVTLSASCFFRVFPLLLSYRSFSRSINAIDFRWIKLDFLGKVWVLRLNSIEGEFSFKFRC